MRNKRIERLFRELVEDAYLHTNAGCMERALELSEAFCFGKFGRVFKLVSSGDLKSLLPSIVDTKGWKFQFVCTEGEDVYDPSAGVVLRKDEYVQYMFPQQEVGWLDRSPFFIENEDGEGIEYELVEMTESS